MRPALRLLAACGHCVAMGLLAVGIGRLMSTPPPLLDFCVGYLWGVANLALVPSGRPE